MKIRRYSELSSLSSYEERFAYLKLSGVVGESTFGFDRYLNQVLYRSKEWKAIRDAVILRDNGCDMGLDGYWIGSKTIIHHMNPITQKLIDERSPDIFDPEYLVCVSQSTHNAIHFGDEKLLPREPIDRQPFDTCPWKQKGGRDQRTAY